MISPKLFILLLLLFNPVRELKVKRSKINPPAYIIMDGDTLWIKVRKRIIIDTLYFATRPKDRFYSELK